MTARCSDVDLASPLIELPMTLSIHGEIVLVAVQQHCAITSGGSRGGEIRLSSLGIEFSPSGEKINAALVKEVAYPQM